MDTRVVITDERNRKAKRILPEEEKPQWWAMSAPYQREMKAKELLDSHGIANFVPMHWEKKVLPRGGWKEVLVPVIHNLIFAYCTKTRIQQVKKGVPYLQFHTRPGDGAAASDRQLRVPIIVPDKQMEDFMRVCGTFSRHLHFYGPDELPDLAAGTPVRIKSGSLKGVEGTFVRIKGHRSRKVVINIPFVASVVPMTIDASEIEEVV